MLCRPNPHLMSLVKEEDFEVRYGTGPVSLLDGGVPFGKVITRALEHSNVYNALERAGPFGKFVKRGNSFLYEFVKPSKEDIYNVRILLCFYSCPSFLSCSHPFSFSC